MVERLAPNHQMWVRFLLALPDSVLGFLLLCQGHIVKGWLAVCKTVICWFNSNCALQIFQLVLLQNSLDFSINMCYGYFGFPCFTLINRGGLVVEGLNYIP